MLGHLPTQVRTRIPHYTQAWTRPAQVVPTHTCKTACVLHCYVLLLPELQYDAQEEERTCVSACVTASVNFPVRRPHR